MQSNVSSPAADSAAPAGVFTPLNRLTSIDFLRGLAALAVLVGHMMIWGDRMPREVWWFKPIAIFFDYGYLGVPLFFVISGFCIHLTWAKHMARTGTHQLKFFSFWKRRFRRLYPPYLVVLCLSMGLLVIAVLLRRNVPMLDIYGPDKWRGLAQDFGLHLFMLHGLHPVYDKGAGNSVFWTLAREEYFYLGYFFLLALRRRVGIWPTMGVLAAMSILFPILVRPYWPQKEWLWLHTSVFTLWIQWGLGMAAIEAHFGLVRLPAWMRSIWLVPLWLIPAMFVKHQDPTQNNWLLLEPILSGMGFFTLVNWCVARENLGRWADNSFTRFFAFSGVFSYSLYLIHSLVRPVLKQLVAPFVSADNPVLYFLVAIGMSVVAYGAGRLLFLLVERNFLNPPSEAGAVKAVATPNAAV